MVIQAKVMTSSTLRVPWQGREAETSSRRSSVATVRSGWKCHPKGKCGSPANLRSVLLVRQQSLERRASSREEGFSLLLVQRESTVSN